MCTVHTSTYSLTENHKEYHSVMKIPESFYERKILKPEICISKKWMTTGKIQYTFAFTMELIV